MRRTPTSERKRLGEILVAERVITPDQLEEALATQASAGNRNRLGTTVVEMGLASELDVASALAKQLGLDQVDLVTTPADADALARVPRQLAERHHCLPLRVQDNVLTVAVSDPTNVLTRDDLRWAARVDGVRVVVATESSIRAALRGAYGTDHRALESLVDDDGPRVEEHVDEAEDLANAAGVDDQPIVKLANLVLAEAVHAGASDVHVEPGRNNVRVRYRVDGLLREVMRVPREATAALISRLKIMARLDIAERRRPQDGRAVVRVDGREVDLRVSTLPTMFGETVVMRLLRKGAEQLVLGDIGMASDHLELFRWALDRPQGLVMITGPTGSGKTSTLYGGLQEITDPVRNIVTLEDPIEYQLEGVNQTQINEKVGLTFARGLRSILRQDPDVVLVGEVRDHETAQLAMQASFTGHLVLSTLHTNDAPSSVVRLVDLGIEPFLIASSLLLVAAQRLVRAVCTHCREPYEPDPKVLAQLQLSADDLDGRTLYRGAGCEICGRTGYRGREGIFEMMPVTAAVRELLLEGATEGALRALAIAEGMRTLREDGVRKALTGATTLEEVLRVTPAEFTGLHGSDEHGSDEPATVQPVPPLRAIAGEDGGGAAGAAARPSVLVVDDDPSVRALLRALLEDEYEVREAGDGEAALALSREQVPDAIVLDLLLPGVDGIAVTEQLRADEQTRWVPIVMVTGRDDGDTEVAGLAAGVDDFLRKPFDDEVLLSRLGAARRRVVAEAS